MELMIALSGVVGNRYGVVSQRGASMRLCDGVYSATHCQHCSVFLCVPVCASNTGECTVLRIHCLTLEEICML
jgi:hypothetical protein